MMIIAYQYSMASPPGLGVRQSTLENVTAGTRRYTTCVVQEWKGEGLRVHGTTADVTTVEGREALVKLVS